MVEWQGCLASWAARLSPVWQFHLNSVPIFTASGSGWNLVMLGQGERVAVVFPWGRSLLQAVVV